MNLLTEEFLSQYPDQPEHMNELGAFVFYRTYSRWLDEKDRRETFKEAIARAVEYNVSISVEELESKNIKPPYHHVKMEAEKLFDNIFNLKQFLSGRTHWVGGAESGVADKFPLSNFNCSFIDVVEWNDLSELFYLLLIGTGVGFRCSKENAAKLPVVRDNFTLLHSQYIPVDAEERLQHTKLVTMENGYAKIYVGDSKEGWVNALKIFMQILTEELLSDIRHIKISYNSIRPRGERLKTFGGTASGHEPLKEMFEGFEAVIKGTLDKDLSPIENNQLRPVHIMDMCNLIGNNVVVGGVRRTAEIFLCDADDYESIFAKYGINGIWDRDSHVNLGRQLKAIGIKPHWWDDLPMEDINAKPLHHRRMSNNSIVFEEKPDDAYLETILQLIKVEGEPGFVNMEAASKRRPNAKGLNPCAEVLLDSYGVCNLTTVNVPAFITESGLDYPALMEAQALSVRAGIRMTCLDLELPHWDEIHKRDRLIGASLTGWQDAMEQLGYDDVREENLLQFLSEVAYGEAVKYAHILRIPNPLLATTIKPEGTLSQVAGGVSSGLHASHAPYYIRRIRINKNDPLADLAIYLGWNVHPEVGTLNNDIKFAKTLVIDFPVASGASKTRDQYSVDDQFDTYFRFQQHYTAHNSSITISVRDDEWGIVQERIMEKWNDYVGVAFLPYNGGSYELAPYEEIDEETYHEMKSKMEEFTFNKLIPFEAKQVTDDSDMESCDTGVCPIR